MHLYFATNTPDLYRQVVLLHDWQGLTPPPESKEALGICNEDGLLVASTFLYECGPFLFAEFAVAAPAPLRALHQAAEMLVMAFLATAAARGLRPMATPTSRGVQMLLKRYGFYDAQAPCFIHDGSPLQLTSARVPETATPQKMDPPQRSEAGPSKGPSDGTTPSEESVAPTVKVRKKKAKKRKVKKP